MSDVQTVSLPTQISFKRSISQSRGLFEACDDLNGSGAVPVLVERSGLRGTKAFNVWAKIEKDKKNNLALAKGIEDASTPNPQFIETAFLPVGKPVLKASFEAKYLANSRKPYVCTSREFEVLIRGVVKRFAEVGGFEDLGQRYVLPLITGVWMWRNNDEAIQKRIVVSVNNGLEAEPTKFVFNPSYNATSLEDLSEEDQASATLLGTRIGEALSGKSGLLSLSVEAYYHLGEGSIVFPSQEMGSLSEQNEKSTREKKDEPSRVLYKVRNGGIDNQAALHEQKIGNALRKIDSWHDDDFFGVISVEPLGIVSTHMDSTRIQSKRDFYTLMGTKLKTWSDELAAANDFSDIRSSPEDLKFIVANLVRGGLFA